MSFDAWHATPKLYHHSADSIPAIALGSTASVPVKNQRQAFYFSGMHTLNSDPLLYGLMSEELVPAKSLIMADFSTLGNASWTNLTLPAEVLPRARSQIVWVPVGSQGLLVALGGVPYPPDLFTNFTSEQQDANKQAGSSFMSTVSIFDIATKQWYQQNTTGEIPDQLEGFCAVLAHKADVSQTTFEIFVYGGTNGLERPGGAIPATDNVYVLSMPAFRWFNVHSGNESHARTRHACAMPSPNQMLVVGGWPGTGKCFEDWSTLDVFDLNTLEWLRKFDPHASKPYKTADVLTQQLTNKPGVLTPAVSTLFDTPYSKTISNFYPTAKPRSKSKRLGAIVGGSVAGTVLAALVVLSIWCFRRSMRWSSADRESSITTSSGGPIMRWLRGTQSTMPPKSVMSDATTEVEPAVIFSKAPAELDSRARAESMATGPQAELEEARLNTALHPSRAYSSTRPRRSRSRSPSSQQTVSVEAAGAPLHEVHGESKNLSIPPTMVSSERDGTGLAYLTDHHLYPWDINWTQTEPQADEKAAVADDDKASLQRSPSAVTMPSPVDKRARSTKVADLPQAPNEAAITEMGVEPDQHRQDAAAVEPAPDHAPETRTSTAATPQMSKRDSAVSPLLQQQDISRTRDRTQFSSISSSVSAMDDLPASVVDTTLQSRGPARVDSLAQVIRKRTNGDHESEILNRADTVGDGDRD